MKIATAEQIRALDQATIERESITSLELMERAAGACYYHLLGDLYQDNATNVALFCGPGNNGGDGWVLARLIHTSNFPVTVYDCQIGKRSPDNEANFLRFQKEHPELVVTINEGDKLPELKYSIIIDALFGSGLNRPLTGYWATLIEHINQANAKRYAVDIPSGMFADQYSDGAIINADFTYSFELPKLAFFAPSYAPFLGEVSVISIGLDQDFIEAMPVKQSQLMAADLKASLHHRHSFDHKGTFGHALIIAGSYGKIGAATLSARAALRAGAGLVTVHLPKCGYEIMQIGFPEAMCQIDRHRYIFTQAPDDLTPYQTIGIGPGLGQDTTTAAALHELLQRYDRPLVIDADALNILGKNPTWLKLLPPHSILTPHPKEFERLFGKTENDFQRWELQLAKARELNVIIVLKTAKTSIATPDGYLYFNSTGNPGMGTAGTGDVLTGIITGLLAQSYPPLLAAQLGVFLHGLAGDIAAERTEQESLLASDVIECLGAGFKELRK